MRPVGLIVDIHGHSLKQGAFFYGCSPEKKLLRLRPSSPPLVPYVPSSSSRTRPQRGERDGSRERELYSASSSDDFAALYSSRSHTDAPSQPSARAASTLDPDQRQQGSEIDQDTASVDGDDGDGSNRADGVRGGSRDEDDGDPGCSSRMPASTASEECLDGPAVLDGPSTSRGLQLPSKKSSLRDLLSWRVHLFPRICTALAPLFALESCRYFIPSPPY